MSHPVRAHIREYFWLTESGFNGSRPSSAPEKMKASLGSSNSSEAALPATTRR